MRNDAPWFDDGVLDPDRASEELERFATIALKGWMLPMEQLRLYELACDLSVEVKRLRDKIEEIHTYIPARES